MEGNALTEQSFVWRLVAGTDRVPCAQHIPESLGPENSTFVNEISKKRAWDIFRPFQH